jgi:hypothetical protein
MIGLSENLVKLIINGPESKFEFEKSETGIPIGIISLLMIDKLVLKPVNRLMHR